MKFGVRQCANIVFRAKQKTVIGTSTFNVGQPVLYIDTATTSSMEQASTSVYAQGGRGNARLVAWEGERTITYTMEDALISPEGFMILSGAGLVEATDAKPIYQHVTETVDAADVVKSTATDGNNSSSTVSIPLSNAYFTLPSSAFHIPHPS